jgi:hypothetical protein
MPAIDDLHGVRSADPGRFRILRSAIPADNLNLRMRRQPPLQCLRFPVWSEIQGNTPLQINPNSAIVRTFPLGPVVDAYHPGRSRHWQRYAPDITQQGIRTAPHTQRSRQASACFAAEGKPYSPQGVCQAPRAPR